jgi:hypothetical protein
LGVDEGITLSERRLFWLEKRMTEFEVTVAEVNTRGMSNEKKLDALSGDIRWGTRWSIATFAAVGLSALGFLLTHGHL